MIEHPWVAIIDDDESVRTSLARILVCADIRATGFGSGEAFLERDPGPGPVCLVLDVNLGAGVNGFELQERLEAQGRAPPVVFMTGQPDIVWRSRARAGGGVDYLLKPFSPDELLGRIRHHLLAAISGTAAFPASP